jgi:DNA topoisomerase VI subunit A
VSQKPRKGPPATQAEKDQLVLVSIEDLAREIHAAIRSGRKPTLAFPIRNLGNVSYDRKTGYLEIGDATSERTLTYNTAKTFAQTLMMMQMSQTHVRGNKRSTKREAYYIGKSDAWGEAQFNDQPESDAIIDDIEAMFAERGVTREQLRFIADDHGGSVAGELIVIDRHSKTGEELFIDCTRMGSGAFSIPKFVEHLRFETSAKFILCIETGGAFDRLNTEEYWKKANCILIEMQGVPSRACRRFVRRLADDKKLPVYAFTDCDPYGFANIYRTLKVGSGNAAHINQFYCVPQARFLGVTPQDIKDHKLPTQAMKEVDIKRAQDALKNDPFFSSHKEWVDAIKLQLEMGKRAEQQAFAKYSLEYVFETYLPQKLANPKAFLP